MKRIVSHRGSSVILLVLVAFASGCAQPSMYAPPLRTQTGWIEEETFEKTVYFGTTRIDKCSQGVPCSAGIDRFDTGNARTASAITYGSAKVKIPYRKKIGGVDGMSVNPDVNVLSWDDLKGTLAPNDVLVFIHGFNTSFKDAAIRCAQISFDLNFPGESIFFSWPSETKLNYTQDKERANENITFLSNFLVKIAANSRQRKVHIIAHSMGTYILGKALMDIDAHTKGANILSERKSSNGNKVFNHVILAAGDIAQDEFTQLFGAYKFNELAENYTLYSTYNDSPLRASRIFNYFIEDNGQPRIGDSHNSFFTLKGMDTIDAREEVITQILGHSYYANHSPLITDMYLLLHYSTPPDGRLLIKVIDKDQQKLWFIRPD